MSVEIDGTERAQLRWSEIVEHEDSKKDSIVHGPADGLPSFCKSDVMHPGPPEKHTG